MAINPILPTRVSHNLRTSALTQQLNANQLQLFVLQQQLATGRRLLSTRDDPVAAEQAINYRQVVDQQNQILTNIRAADGFLSATDDGITDISSLLIQAASIASENVNAFTTAEQRASAATVIDSLIAQLQIVGNRQFNGRFLFAGRQTDRAPLDSSLGRVAHVGDDGALMTRVASGTAPGVDSAATYNITVDQLLNLRANPIGSAVDLDPQATPSTRLEDLAGAQGRGIRRGSFRVTEHSPSPVTFEVDLTGADTLTDIIARFNDRAVAAGSTTTLSVVGDHLRITSGGGFNIDVADVANGVVAADLGLRVTGGPPAFDGADIRPRVTLTTRLSDLYGGAGLTLGSGVQIRNGGHTATVSFAGAGTVQDILNRLNTAGVGIRARINDAGTGIEIINLLSGSELRIGENGGQDATRLGIRTLHAGTRLSGLNDGMGLGTVPGADLTITDGHGIQFSVDLSGSVTIGDVIDAINAAATLAGSTLTAGLVANGNGLRLSQASGTQPIAIARANLSPALDDLGLSGVSGSATELVGRDVNPNVASGAFSALYELRDALLANDTRRITTAGGRIGEAQRHVAAVQGQVGARSAAMRQRLERTEDAVISVRELLSQLVDVDYTEAITKFQQAQTAMQANLRSGSSLLGLSLLDFLR